MANGNKCYALHVNINHACVYVTDTVTIHCPYPFFLSRHHFTINLQATSGLSPTTSVISALPYYEYTFTEYLSVTVYVGVYFMLWMCCTKLALHILTCGGKTSYYSMLVNGCSLTWSLLVC